MVVVLEHPPVPIHTFTELKLLTIAHSQFVPSDVVTPATVTDEMGVGELAVTVIGPVADPGAESVKAAGFGVKNKFCALAAPG